MCHVNPPNIETRVKHTITTRRTQKGLCAKATPNSHKNARRSACTSRVVFPHLTGWKRSGRRFCPCRVCVQRKRESGARFDKLDVLHHIRTLERGKRLHLFRQRVEVGRRERVLITSNERIKRNAEDIRDCEKPRRHGVASSRFVVLDCYLCDIGAFCKLLLGQPVREPKRKQNFRERHGASPHLRGFARTYRAYRMTSSRSDGASAEISK